MSCCTVFKMECTVLIFLFEKQLFKELYVIHLIFKNEINNIFPSHKSFLLLSSDTNASFANKPIKFCCSKPNTWRHVFVVVVYVLPSTFSYTTTFFAVGIFPKFRGLHFHSFEKSPRWGVICIWVGSFSRWSLQNSSFLFMTIMWKCHGSNILCFKNNCPSRCLLLLWW